MIAVRIASKSPSVLRSITVSAPYFKQISSLFSSQPISLARLEFPIFALTFVLVSIPIAIGVKFV